ncbi:hypothetical protein QTP86_021401, partial [Hemibagrus guttatus]
MSGNREEERRKLADIINHWNANRLDLFEISQPTEELRVDLTFSSAYPSRKFRHAVATRALVETGLLLVEEVEEGGECTDRERRGKETRWKGSKARSIGAGFKLFYYGVDSKRNGVGVVLKEEFVRNVLEVKRVSDRVMSLKLEIEGVMLNVVSGYAPQVGCELEEKERFWSELDEVMESIPTGERVVMGADSNGHVGEGNRGDEEVMGKFGVKERNLEGQMVVDFAKRMDMAVVNTYFQKREEHRVTYKSGGRRTQVDYILCRRGNLKEISDCKVVVGESVARQHRMVVCRMTLMVCKKKRSKIEIEKKTKWWKLKKEECCEEFREKLRQALGGQVVLPDDWETTAEVIREKAKKKWDMDRTEENRQEYKELQRRVKREVSKAKQKAYDELYTRLDTREGEKDLYRLARQRDRDGKDVQQVRVIKDRDGRVLTSEENVQRRWKEYFEELMNEENEREKRVEGVNSVEQKVDKIRKDEVRKALKRMKSGKAVGPDDIPVEVWKCLGEAAVEFLTSLFNRVLERERMPEEWRRSVLVPIFKNKGDVQSCSNYRGIKSMSHTMKVWERVVEARLRKVVEICEQQYGFMPRKSTTDAIFALRILMEKYRDGQKELHCVFVDLEKAYDGAKRRAVVLYEEVRSSREYREGQRELHCVFVDLEKAYDRVPREELWYCMRKSGVAEKYVRVVQDMYERSRTVVRCAVGQTEEFKVEVGLHQGSALSPFLFAIVMDQLSEEVRQESPWTMMFADDIVICSESREQVEENLERWRFALERRGMKVSRSKTEYMCVNEREGSGTVRLQGEEVKKVQEFKYLGSTVQSNGECGKEELEFHGVMRFYFQDRVAGNFATKCIRVSSTATTQDVIETLAEKFRPDMRMLSSPKYSLYEVHVSGEERKLDLDEKPLVVQLNWNKDDREGRFVLKNENDIIPKKIQSNGPEKEKEGVIQNFKRTLSKKEKKKEKKRDKEASARIPDGDEVSLNREDGENSRLAAEVYKDMPETSFTRTISNPEVVMKRRRQQKLEKRMQEFRSGDGRPDSGGTLRIYADSLKPNIPYKTILLSTTDTADFAVGEALEKYGLEKENPREYCIARVVHSDDKPVKETILEDSECPLQIFRDWTSDKEMLVFQLKKRPPDFMPKKGLKPGDRTGPLHGALPPEKLPYLVELSPGRGNHYAYYAYRQHEDGSDSRDKPKLYRLQHSVTEVGSDRNEEGNIQLFGPGILPHHCDLRHTDGLVTITPVTLDAETFLDGQRISDTTVLRSGMTLQFGAAHVFKFVDPSYDHGLAKRDPGGMVKGRHKSGSVPETTFDLHGDLHSGASITTSKSSGKLDMDRPGNMGERGMVKPMIRTEPGFAKHDGRLSLELHDGSELTLPASIEFRDNSEDAFLSAIINYTNSSTVHFKLSPTYVLYMTCRYVLSSHFRPDISASERTHKVIAIVNKMVSMMEGVIQKQKNIAGALAFWMANASELLNFIKQDKDLSRITLDAQDVLAHLVQLAFKYLVHCLQSDLNNYMPAFLDDPEEQNPQRPKIEDVLHTLTGAMSLLRRCRVNAALTIQLFSQLFHFINMWLFNKLVTESDSGLCSHYWGAILRQQLSHIEAWAEKQGLELAADCHLSRIVQATTLLTMDKYSVQDVQNINNTCFKLNSLQLNALMSNYHCAPDEPYIPPELIDHVVSVAENTADELARSDGREVQLEEDPDLQLPFLLPEDGYSCDVVRNIPNGFQEFLEPLCQRGFCRLTPHPRSPGTWTVYFEGADCDSHFSADNADLPMRKEPEVVTVTLKKHNGMGLSIVAAKVRKHLISPGARGSEVEDRLEGGRRKQEGVERRREERWIQSEQSNDRLYLACSIRLNSDGFLGSDPASPGVAFGAAVSLTELLHTTRAEIAACGSLWSGGKTS